MKKICIAIVLFILACIITGCAASGADSIKDDPSPTAAPLVVDLDLSKLSGTVVYAQVYNLMNDYESWLGKVIKMSGYYSAYIDMERGVVYHACVIPDATACCAQGIEFVWAGEHAWPDEYPEEGADITVTGRLDIYEEDGDLYLYLADSEMNRDPGI